MYKAILIPTDEKYLVKGRINLFDNKLTICEYDTNFNTSNPMQYSSAIPQHLIIISDEEIKKGDLYFFGYNQVTTWADVLTCQDVEEAKRCNSENTLIGQNCHKIIASTNPQHNLPGITTESIQKWIDADCPEEIELKLTDWITDEECPIAIAQYRELLLANNQVTIVVSEKKVGIIPQEIQNWIKKKGYYVYGKYWKNQRGGIVAESYKEIEEMYESEQVHKPQYIPEPGIEQLAETQYPTTYGIAAILELRDAYVAGWEACKKHYGIK